MRERLTNLIKNEIDTRKCNINIDWLIDYLLENNVVVLPCSVGDTVWYVTNGKCKDVRIENVHQ